MPEHMTHAEIQRAALDNLNAHNQRVPNAIADAKEAILEKLFFLQHAIMELAKASLTKEQYDLWAANMATKFPNTAPSASPGNSGPSPQSQL